MTEWYAIESFRQALDKTKETVLDGFNLKFWLQLALIVTIASGVVNFSTDMNFEGVFPEDANISSGAFIYFLVAFFAFYLIVSLVFAYLSAISSFVKIKAIISKDLDLKNDFENQSENGLKYFLFLVGLYSALILFIVASAIIAGYILGNIGSQIATIISILIAIIGFFLIFLIIAILSWLVEHFVVPIVYLKNGGIIENLKYLLELIKKEFWQFVIYILVYTITTFFVAMILLMLSLFISVGAFILYFVINILMVFGLMALDPSSIGPKEIMFVGIFTIITIGVKFVVSYIVNCIFLPVNIFFQIYGMLFLEKIDPSLKFFKGKKKKKERKEKIKVH
jgi:hypothetical protein